MTSSKRKSATSALPAVIPRRAHRLPVKRMDEKRLYDDFLAHMAPRTRMAYDRDLRYFAEFMGMKTGQEAAAHMATIEHGEANAVVLEYRTALSGKKLSSSTINRRLASIRSLVKLANTLGYISWSINVAGLKQEKARDMSGPGEQVYMAMLDLLKSDVWIAARNRAMVRLLYDSALRRSEVVSIDFEDMDLAAGTAMVKGKGRREKAPMPVPAPTLQAISKWIKFRGNALGPLFTNRSGNRLSDHSLYLVVVNLGKALGVTIRPHGLRHSAGTKVVIEKGIRHGQSFLRHANVQTTMGYVDDRKNEAREAADHVAPPEED